MRVVRRDPDKLYLANWLWVPKTLIPYEAIKQHLTVIDNSGRDEQRVAQLYEETASHLAVPRSFYAPDHFKDQTIVDVRPTAYETIKVVSSITLDAKNPLKTVQRDAQQVLLRSDGGILQLACGKGKAQPVSTPVLTPHGWVPIGELRPGRLVIGSNGRPTRVRSIHPQGLLPVFRVTMEDGTSTRCCDEHLWYTQTPADRRKGVFGQVRTLSTIRNTLRTKAGANHAVPRVPEVHYVKKEPVFSPWLMGFYLGDGSSGVYKGARRVQFDKPREDLLAVATKELAALGDDVVAIKKDKRSSNLTLSVKFTHGQSPKIWSELQRMGLVGLGSLDKFIPEEYLRASVEERWDLLAGLLDADGSVVPTGRTLSTSSRKMAEGVVELARSLGCRVTTEERQTTFTYLGQKRQGAPSWRLYITNDRWGNGRYNHNHYIQSIEPAGVEECVCIAVEADDQMYVTENFILTHNTVVALDTVAKIAVPTVIAVDNTTLLQQWKEEIERFLHLPDGFEVIRGTKKGDWSKPLVLTTYKTLSEIELPEHVRRRFGVFIGDEAHHIPARTYSRAASLFFGRRYALTATPQRPDGFHVILEHHMGKVLYKDLTQELTPKVVFLWTSFLLDLEDADVKEQTCDYRGELHLGKIASYFGRWRARLEFIVLKLQEAKRQGRKILVLSNSVEELAGLMAIWRGLPIFNELPEATVTPEDIGMPGVVPHILNDITLKNVEKKRAAEVRLINVSTLHNPVRRSQAVLLVKKYDGMLEQHACAQKLREERDKRLRAYARTLIDDKIGLLISDVKVDERKAMVDKREITFAISKYGREGLDCAALDTVFACEGMSQKGGLQQFMGRVLRKTSWVKSPLVVFFEDDISPMRAMCEILRRHLREWPIEEGGPYDYRFFGNPHRKSDPTWLLVNVSPTPSTLFTGSCSSRAPRSSSAASSRPRTRGRSTSRTYSPLRSCRTTTPSCRAISSWSSTSSSRSRGSR